LQKDRVRIWDLAHGYLPAAPGIPARRLGRTESEAAFWKAAGAGWQEAAVGLQPGDRKNRLQLKFVFALSNAIWTLLKIWPIRGLSDSISTDDVRGDSMRNRPGFFDVDDRLKRLSDLGDRLEAFRAAVDFEMFRPDLDAALAYSDGAQGGRLPFDPVMMFKVLVIQTTNNLSDERAEFLINDRLSFMRFLGLGLSDRIPGARTIWLFREKLTKAGAIGPLFERFDATLRQSGYIAMPGQIVDASLIAAPRQRNTNDEKKAIKAGRVPDNWKDKPAKLRQKDRDADKFTQSAQAWLRWTVKFTKAKPREDGSTPPADLAIPVFGYQNHISIDRGFGFIRKWSATDAAAYEGRRLREGLLDKTNTASAVWADTAYRSKANEEFMEKNGFVSHVHRKKPKGRAMPEAIRRANNVKSKVRSRVEHVFAGQKDRMGLFIRTIGIARATAKTGLANLVYNIKRLLFLQRIAVA
jgi:IS5 family transposase